MVFSSRGQSLEIELEWKTTWDTVRSLNDFATFPGLENLHFDGKKYVHLSRFDRASSTEHWNLEINSFSSESIDQKTSKFITENGFSVTDKVQFEKKNIMSMGKPVLAVSIFPFVKVNGAIQRLNTVLFDVNKQNIYQVKANEFAANSVLRSGSGDWYKITVDQNGIYRIDYNLLSSMGIDVDAIDPSSINIYGNAFGRLPENNSDERPDDLIKNDIYIQGEGDGSFDNGDFILFYGRGPHKWEQTGTDVFSRTLNNYSNNAAYFININPSEAPARIQSADLSSLTETNTVTDYNNFTIHESESRNLIKGGQRWYGETFDAELSQTFSFFIRNLNPNEPGFVRSAFACSEGGSSTTFEVRYNNTLIGDDNLSAVGSDSYSRGIFFSMPGVFNPTSSSFALQVVFNRTSPSDIGYLDFIEVNARSYLDFGSGTMEFRDLNSVGAGNVSLFQISNFSSGDVVWEITERTNPKLVNGTLNGSTYEFKVATDSLRTFVAFDGSNYKTPRFVEKVRNQNLHGLAQADYLIVTHPTFLAQANRLKSLHEANGLSVHVVTTSEVYNEFSGGTQDPTAIKFFAKMFYERAEGDPGQMPKYLCLFGDGTYDPKNRVSENNYMVPVYHTVNSEGYISTLLSDDYFGFLDDGESFSPSDELDIAVGRLVATTAEDAKNLVDKIEHYMKNGSSIYAGQDLSCGDDGFISTHGDWRLRYTLISDDEENGYFLINDLEPVYNYTKANHPEMNAKKIYSDAYTQTTTAGGERYPEVNDDISRSIESGSILACYVGHGGAMGAASERIITIGQIQELQNIDKLTLFVSATCEFGRMDDNERVSAGEWMALNELGGAIALMTASRAVYFSTNSITTDRFFQNVFTRNADEEPLTFGEIITQTKNAVVGGSNNKRSFMLLGDPALKIALPFEQVVLDSINEVDVNQTNDTIRALSKVRMKGHIEDQFGNTLSGYNGILEPSVLDKPILLQTLGQDAQSPVIQYEQQLNVLFRGKASVTNGIFDFDFIVPKDINYSYGNGKASFYGYSDQDLTAGGYSESFIIGGIDTTGLDDSEGPQIDLYLNDDSFVNGGITDETPILIAQLFDESGINTVGNGIGHDITLVIDENTSEAIVLNEFYNSDLDTYQSGELSYQIGQLEPGLHTMTFKAWDVNNNSSEKTIEFTVQESSELALDHVLNYPNPFTTSTEFYFEHNQVCAALETQIEIFTVTGRLVKTINQTVETRGYRTEGIAWDGRDEFGDQLAKGVYVYRVTVRTPEGKETRAMEKLYLLK
tara:strand:+ start:413 stop:4231 length:3819 start_codon:yes stop_codon:yes gene_type:complete